MVLFPEVDALFLALIRGLRELDPDIGAIEVADALFLAAQLGKELSANQTKLPLPPRTGDQTTVDGLSGISESHPVGTTIPETASRIDQLRIGQIGDAAEKRATEERLERPAGASELYADVHSPKGQRARRVRAPAGKVLSEPLKIARALRPLMRRSPSRARFMLDVEATVEHAAALRLAGVQTWLPIQQPEREPWLSVDLIMDDNATMAPWRETLDEFWRLLEGSGGFRSVRRWGWDTCSAGRLNSLYSLESEQRQYVRPPIFGARVVLAISDCLGPAWHDGTAFAGLADWGYADNIALLQLLPQHLWNRTALGNAHNVWVRSATPGAANRLLPVEPHTAEEDVFAFLARFDPDNRKEEITDELGGPRRVPIPIVTLDPKRLAPWARLVAGRAVPPVSAVLVSSPHPKGRIPEHRLAASDADNARRLVEAFRGYASPGARRLAVYLTAAAPLTLTVMRVVRDAMVRKPSETQIAEILMSGFLREIPGAGAGEQGYNWEPGVQRELSFSLKRTDLTRVGRAVVGWMNARTGSPRELTALTPDPAGTERLVLTEETLPFARLYADNLRLIHREAEANRLASRLVAYSTSASGRGGITEETDGLASGLEEFTVPLQEEAKSELPDMPAVVQQSAEDREAVEDLEEGESGLLRGAVRPTVPPVASSERQITVRPDVVGSTLIAGDVVTQTVTIIHQYGRAKPEPEEPVRSLTGFPPSPYKGLEAFYEEDADRFFGRKAVVDTLWQRLRALQVPPLPGQAPRTRLLAIVGPSGSGKSSIARAGLVPELVRRPIPGLENPRVAIVVPYTEPIEALAMALARIATNEPAPVAKFREFAEELRRPNHAGVHDGLCRIANVLPVAHHHPLLVLVDQFEEVFTFAEEAERSPFIETLLDAARDGSGRISVVLILRSDFLSATARYPALNAAIAAGAGLVPAMTEAELRDAISLPAEQAAKAAGIPNPLDPGTVELLAQETVGRVGALPLLQFALIRIWDGLAQGTPAAETLRNLGGVGGALAAEAETIFSAITANGVNPKMVWAFQRLFTRLVTPGDGQEDVRRVVDRRELGNEAWSLAQRLAGAGNRLVVTNTVMTADGLGDETAVLAHEALIRSWPRLIEWVNQDRAFLLWLRRLKPRVDEWRNLSKDPDTLLRGRPLEVAQDWLARRPEDFNQEERAYIEAGLALRKAGAQAVRRVEQAQAIAVSTRVAILYLDFDLMIRRRTQGAYQAQVLSSPAGEAWADFTFPFTELELENFILRVGRPRRGYRRIDSPEMAAAKNFGKLLYDAVFSGDIGLIWRRSLSEAEAQNAGLRLRLRVADVPELNDVPWEYLYNAGLNQFLSLSEYTPLVRYVDMPEPIRPLRVEGQLDILVMISSPIDYPVVDVEGEWSRLNEALAGPIGSGQVRLRRLSEARLRVLQRELRQGEYHILHFIGHAGFDRQTQGGVLIVGDEEGRGRLVAAENLGAILHDHRSLRLVVLNACEGARASRADPFTGLAQTLVQQGVPAVVAMQFEVTDQSAITFAEEFYGATAVGYPVDAALSCARKAIFAAGSDIEWGTPVLFTRAADGKLFSVNREAAQRAEEKQRAEAARRAEEERQQAEAAWQAAEQRLPRIAISYRREDSAAITGRIFDRLVAYYGRDAVFRDIEAIPLGVDFRGYINTILAKTDVGLVVVGKRWFGARRGGRRIDNPADPVRVELEIILRRGMPVVPILVEGGAMPTADQLPDSLKELVYHNGLDVDSGRDFDQYIERLIRNIDPILIGAERRRAEEEKRQAEAARIAEEEKQWAEAARRAEEEQQRAEAARQAEEKKAGLSIRNSITAIMKRWREGRGRGEGRQNR